MKSKRKEVSPEDAICRLESIFSGTIEAVGRFYSTSSRWYVKCKSCDRIWNPFASSLFQGYGCAKCNQKNSKKRGRKSLSRDEALKRLNEISKGKIVALEEYQGTQIVWHVRCTQCGNDWRILPCNVFRGNGCPFCHGRGFKINRPAIAYYLRIWNESGLPFYKIGITHRLIKRRYPGESHKLTVLKIWDFLTGLEAYQFEQKILRENADYLHRGECNLRTGKSEIFTRDVLGLDGIVPEFYLDESYV